MIDWLDRNFTLILIFVGLPIVAATAFLEHTERQIAKDVFMAQCLQDHRQYECDALWNR